MNELLDVSGACSTMGVHELFIERVRSHPETEAVVFGKDRLTYRDLDRRSNRLARLLIEAGLKPEDRIGVFMDRSAELIVSILGILKIGAAYLPIDVDYPTERVDFMVRDSELRLVLTQHKVVRNLPKETPTLCVDVPGFPGKDFSDEPIAYQPSPESIAVINYTSGSTGKPKAACIPHRAIVRTVRDTNYVQIVPQVDRIAQASSPAFDAAIMEIWLALSNGATLVGVSRESLLDMNELPKLIQREAITIFILNTSYVHQIGRDAPEVLKGVRKVIFGGETAEPVPLRKLLHHVGPGVLVNSYGPTEGCVITSFYEIKDVPEDAVTIPIGCPVANTQVYLLDSELQRVDMGVSGEIYIGGEGVARGYLNNPALTAERFVPDVFSGRCDRSLYRTGDFARMRPDGLIEFIGRNDEQVKIRGHRIELAEVRHALSSHPAIKQLFLMVREDVQGDKRLVAYVTLHPECSIAEDSLRRHVTAKLPSEMAPSAFVILDTIPLNANGKVDRGALPQPTERLDAECPYRAPETMLEHRLALIWQQLLRLDRIGIDDNFFDLGGHSLLAARLIAKIEKQLGTNLPMATLFKAPTIALLAAHLQEQSFEHSWSPLVELRRPEKGSPEKPFFCVHSLGANLVSFHNIASLLRPDRPIYGLQPHGLDGCQRPLDSIESMASAYLEEIRKKQPAGPYSLGGICLGGVIAYEIAQQLRAVGEDVALLVLMDSYVPGKPPYLRFRSPLSAHIDRHLGEMMLVPAWAVLRHLIGWAANGAIRFGRLLGLRQRSSLAEATRVVAKAHHRAFFSYRPKPYAGKIIQLMCGDASHRSYEDRRLAWSLLTTKGFEVRLVPGNHHTMVEQPNSEVLARELQECLDRSSQSDSGSKLPSKGEFSTNPDCSTIQPRLTVLAS